MVESWFDSGPLTHDARDRTCRLPGRQVGWVLLRPGVGDISAKHRALSRDVDGRSLGVRIAI